MGPVAQLPLVHPAEALPCLLQHLDIGIAQLEKAVGDLDLRATAQVEQVPFPIGDPRLPPALGGAQRPVHVVVRRRQNRAVRHRHRVITDHRLAELLERPALGEVEELRQLEN